MAGSINTSANFGSFVPSTNIWEIQQLQSLDIDPQLKELLVRLYQNINNISVSLNTRDSGYYYTQEFINGQIYFPNPALNSTTAQSPTPRQVFRTIVNFGPLPNASLIAIAHNIDITSSFSFTRIYGTASDTSLLTYLPIPYASVVSSNNNIELSVDDTDVIITTAADYSNYNIVYVVLEYIKQ